MTVSLIGKRIGNYDIQSKLGEGGMGAVFLGVHPQIGKRVAVKVLHEELSEKQDVVTRFFNEAKSVNDISHPNIVDIVDFGETNIEGSHFKYIVMEFLDGESLSSRIRSSGVSIRETLYIIAQCGSALSASHKKGVVHRDLKPENIYLCTRGADKNYVKILDFGIAKLTGDQAAMSQKTRTGMVIGTPAYMSPEQCEGRGLIDHRSDIYALGVVMYELLTGRVPFPGDGFGEVLVAHLTRDPPLPTSLNANIPPEIEALVMHCLRKDKAARFQSMDELVGAINDPVAHYNLLMQAAQFPPGSSADMGTIVLGTGQQPMVSPLAAGVPMAPHAGGASAPWTLPASMHPGAQAGSQVLPLPMHMMGGSQVLPLPMGGSQVLALPGGEAGRVTGMAMRSSTGQSLMPQDLMVQGAQGPRPTTLSGTAGEAAGQGRRPISVLLGFSAAMLIGVVAMVGIRALKKPSEVVAVNGGGQVNAPEAPAPPVKAPPVKPQPPAVQWQTVTIASNPPGAEVVRDDVLDQSGKPDVTPAKLRVKKGATLNVKLKLDGYSEETRSLVVDKDQALSVDLAKVAPPETPPSVEGKEPKDRHHRDKGVKVPRKKRDKKGDDGGSGGLTPMF